MDGSADRPVASACITTQPAVLFTAVRSASGRPPKQTEPITDLRRAERVTTTSPTVRPPRRRKHPGRVLTAVLLCCVVTSLASCGKTITITDQDDEQAAADPVVTQPPATTPPATTEATTEAAAGGDDAVQLVGNTAEEAGKTGNGGTVEGVAVQEVPPKWVQLSAVSTAALPAEHLVNINEATLYRFESDTPDTSTSACNGDCATQWPPVTVQDGGSIFLDGLDGSGIGAFRREDGTIQLTVGGWPIYRFSGDAQPGDLNGQGLNGLWFVVGPSGEAVQ